MKSKYAWITQKLKNDFRTRVVVNGLTTKIKVLGCIPEQFEILEI